MTTRRFRAGIVAGSLLASWPKLVGAGSTVALFHPGGSAADPDQGDYISSNAGAGLDSPYRYFIEVTPGLSRLQLDLFDADIGLGGVTAENNANRDRQRTGAWNTATRYTLNDPNGATQATLLGDVTGPALSDNAWIALFDSRVPQFRTSTTATVNPAAANITIAVPAGTANNDLLIAIISRDASATAIPTPGGWTLVNEGACAGTGTCRLGVFRRVASGEPASYTFALGVSQEAVGTMLRYTGIDTTTPIDTNIAFATGNTATPTAPTVNTTVPNTRVIRVVSANDNSLPANPHPRDHTGRFALGTGTIISGAAADELQSAAGATGAAAFTLSAAEQWRALTFAIRPAATAPAPDAGHWEVLVDLSSAVTGGDDLSAFGLRAHDGDATSSGTELNVYYDSHTEYGVNDSPAPAPRNYDVFPYVTSGCSSSSNNWDFDAGGSASAITFSSRTAGFTQSFTDAQLSPNNTWVANALTGWTTDSSSIEYGIWHLDLDLSQTAGGANYGLIWLGNFLVASPTPAANPTTNAFRVYLPTDGGVAPVKPYLEQLLTYVSGAQTPTVGQTTVLSVTVRVVNPTNRPIEFSASNLVTANVPGPATDVTYQGNAQISQGSLTGEPAVGGIGDVIWNPGTLAAGATGLLAYRVAVTPTASPQRIPVTGVVSTGTGADGTRARFVDETGNTTQARATYRLGPVCELAASVNVLTPAVVSSVRAKDSGRGVIVEWDTVSEVGTIGFDLLRWDRDSAQYVKVNDKLLMGLVASPQGGRYRVVDPGASRFGTHTYVLSEVEASGSRRYHGPFQAKVEAATSRDTAISAEGYARAPRRMTAALGRTLQTRRQEAAVTALAAARATAPAMKIGIEFPGVYRIPAGSIAATLGLPLSRVQALIASHRFALSHRGRPVAWMPALSDGLLFYGEGIDSIYTRDNVYWLRQGSGLRMGAVVGGTPQPAPEQSFQDARHTEQDRLAATIVSSDPESDYWYWDYLSGGDPTHGRKSFPFLAPSLASGGDAASLRVGLHGATSTGVANEHHVVMRLNGVSVGEARWQGIAPQTIDVSIGSSLLQEGENTVEVEAFLESGVPWSIVYVDAIDLAYPRRYQAEADSLAFRGDGHPVVTVDSFSDGRIVILDLTDPLRPKRVVRVTTDMRPQGRFLVSFIPSSPETPYVAVAPPGWRSPKWVKADLPSRLKARNQGADHVIVTTQELLAPAKRLEAMREGQGLRSIVVDLQDVMDEFGDGIDSPHAIKAFLAYARQSWSPAPRFVLLAGTGSFDYKDNLGLGGNLVPPLMAGTPSGLFASDNRLVDLAGDDLVPEIAIGRVPVLTAAELDAYVSKIQAYEASDGAGWKERALWVADNPEGAAANFPADATRVAANLLPGYAPEAIYLADGTITATRTQLLNGFANGASLLNYVGHGGLDRLAAEGLLVTADAEALTNGERLPVVTALTCIINRFEVPGFVPLGAALVKNGAGGASAVWAPTGLSKNAEAVVLGARFYSEHSSAPDERVGEIVRRSLEAYAGADRERSLLNVYNLFGDPALLFKQPDQAPGGGGDILPSGRSHRE